MTVKSQAEDEEFEDEDELLEEETEEMVDEPSEIVEIEEGERDLFEEIIKENGGDSSKKGKFSRYCVMTTLSNINLDGIVLNGVRVILREYNAQTHNEALRRFFGEMFKACGKSQKAALEKCYAIFGEKIEIRSYNGRTQKVKNFKLSCMNTLLGGGDGRDERQSVFNRP